MNVSINAYCQYSPSQWCQIAPLVPLIWPQWPRCQITRIHLLYSSLAYILSNPFTRLYTGVSRAGQLYPTLMKTRQCDFAIGRSHRNIRTGRRHAYRKIHPALDPVPVIGLYEPQLLVLCDSRVTRGRLLSFRWRIPW